MFLRNETRIVGYGFDNRKKIIVGFIRNNRSAKYLFWANIVVWRRKIYDEIAWEQIIICQRNKNICKRCSRVTNVCRFCKLGYDLPYMLVDFGWVKLFFIGVYRSIISLIINNTILR